jgi:gluconate 2-dehydrogenase alpha chain
VTGRNYAYQITSSVNVFLDENMNPFMGAGALGQAVDEFNGDNFDHGPLGFLGGGYIALWTTGGRPILQQRGVPEGTPKWGGGWKRAMHENYLNSVSVATHGSVMSYRDSYLDLDPTYRDVYGNPLLRLTFDFHDNERKMSKFETDKAALIAKAMNPRSIKINYREGHYSILPYETTHNTGGAAMGADPKTSVVNPYLQSWDVSNVFVMGSSVFPQNPGYNPTGTVGALAYWAADAIRTKYLKNPGPLVHA